MLIIRFRSRHAIMGKRGRGETNEAETILQKEVERLYNILSPMRDDDIEHLCGMETGQPRLFRRFVLMNIQDALTTYQAGRAIALMCKGRETEVTTRMWCNYISSLSERQNLSFSDTDVWDTASMFSRVVKDGVFERFLSNGCVPISTGDDELPGEMRGKEQF